MKTCIPWTRCAPRLSALLLIAICFAGCGPSSGIKRFSLSGSITMPDGKPVPAGEINFEPDGQLGNSGPASIAQINAGKYTLSSENGVVGGKYIVTIMPYDGVAAGESTQGKPLVQTPHVEKVELPSENTTKDFVVKSK